MKNSTRVPSPSGIDPVLIKRLKGLIEETQITGSKALSQKALQSYWQIGDEITNLGETSHADLKTLAKKADASYTLLKRCRQFRQNWPQGLNKTASELTWSDHLKLLPITDTKVRDFYIKESFKNGWKRDSLARAIASNLFDRAQTGDYTTPTNFKIKSPLFCYWAQLLRIVDADTLDVLIDIGFGMFTKQRVRLKGLNCPEHQKGRPDPALAFVTNKLKDCEHIVVKTYKADIYGRFLADVYYHPDLTNKDSVATKGYFLNGELLDKKLAKPMLV